MATNTTTTTTKKSVEKKPDPNWPVKVAGTDFVLEKDDALICIFDTTRPGSDSTRSKVSLQGSDGRRYRVYRGMLTSKKLFPNWKKYKPVYLIEFKGDPKGKGCVVPGVSAR